MTFSSLIISTSNQPIHCATWKWVKIPIEFGQRCPAMASNTKQHNTYRLAIIKVGTRTGCFWPGKKCIFSINAMHQNTKSNFKIDDVAINRGLFIIFYKKIDLYAQELKITCNMRFDNNNQLIVLSKFYGFNHLLMQIANELHFYLANQS